MNISFVNPVVLGSGKPLFKNIKDRHNLLLANIKAFIRVV